MHSTLLIFMDGVGIGRADPEINPFFKYPFRIFNDIFGQTPSLDEQYLSNNGKVFLFPTDATLGVEGLPQSGTGQTSIFCGVNAPQMIGQHFGPYPHSKLLPTLKEKNIFIEFLRLNKKVVFVNAYPQIFFDYVNSGRQRLSVTTLSCNISGVKLHDYNDLKEGNALSAEIDNSRWVHKLNYELPVISPETAADRLLNITSQNDLTVFEYFLTDHLGHWRNADTMEETLHVLDSFLYHVITNFNPDNTLVICSDHGNLEDISVKTHTFNPSLTITAGKNAYELSQKLKDLTQIKPAILELYE